MADQQYHELKKICLSIRCTPEVKAFSDYIYGPRIVVNSQVGCRWFAETIYKCRKAPAKNPYFRAAGNYNCTVKIEVRRTTFEQYYPNLMPLIINREIEHAFNLRHKIMLNKVFALYISTMTKYFGDSIFQSIKDLATELEIEPHKKFLEKTKKYYLRNPVVPEGLSYIIDQFRFPQREHTLRQLKVMGIISERYYEIALSRILDEVSDKSLFAPHALVD